MCGNIYMYTHISLSRVNLLQARTFFITTPPFISKKSLLPDLSEFFAPRSGPAQTLWCWSRIYDNSSDELQGNIVTSRTTSPQVRRPLYDIFNPSKSSCTTSRDITVARWRWQQGGRREIAGTGCMCVCVYVEGAAGKEEEKVGRYKLHRAVDEARSKLGKLSSPCIGPVPGYTPL